MKIIALLFGFCFGMAAIDSRSEPTAVDSRSEPCKSKNERIQDLLGLLEQDCNDQGFYENRQYLCDKFFEIEKPPSENTQCQPVEQ